MEYARNLKKLQEKVGDTIKIVMRVYTAKPRSSVGRKGIERGGEPESNLSPDEALYKVRKLMLTIAQMGIPIANELLYIENTPYIDDLLSYGVIGSRNSLSQPHRELASGMECAMGIKNLIISDPKLIADSILAASKPQELIYDGAICETTGNPAAHVVLRGENKDGISIPNTTPEAIQQTVNELEKRNLNPNIIIDLNHDNSGKDGLKQPTILKSLIAQNNEHIVWVMMESYLHDGKQAETLPSDQIVHGKSLTDSCLGWEKTEQAVLNRDQEIKAHDLW